MTLALALAAAYIVGSVPTSQIVARLAGIDLRAHGSHNLGATNLYRVLGWRYAVPVAVLDIAKGAVPVWLFTPRVGSAEWIPLALGGAAVVGHVFSVFARFRGGKGVATAAGVVLALAPVVLVATLGVWVLVLKVSGYVSLASVTAAVALVPLALLVGVDNPWVPRIGVVLAAFIVFTHRDNLRRLLAGQEQGLGRRGA